MKNYLGECSLKVTRPNGEHSKILVSNPEISFPEIFQSHNYQYNLSGAVVQTDYTSSLDCPEAAYHISWPWFLYFKLVC